ncbi:hypothetical protein GCM10015535_04260 [Streptomyces gelaticus]|uniref:Uncharacterized protein n=1 Tax=Streptomyces gelaticus TaxID=285446 RepID=A0ABQ2VRM5_9ACTN|nr:hypothetical protein GCM10015535_04260 [Streptomyces gelaticus]
MPGPGGMEGWGWRARIEVAGVTDVGAGISAHTCGGAGSRLVPGGLPCAFGALGRQADAGTAHGRCTCGGTGFPGDHRTQHRRGTRILGNSDTHLEGRIGIPHTVVLAEELSVDAVLAGIRAGRSWIAESAAVQLSFTVSAGGRSVGIGERLEAGGAPVGVRADVRGVPSGTVSFHTERGRAHHASLPASGSGTVQWRTGTAESAFVRVEVRRPDGRMAALGNPVVLT